MCLPRRKILLIRREQNTKLGDKALQKSSNPLVMVLFSNE